MKTGTIKKASYDYATVVDSVSESINGTCDINYRDRAILKTYKAMLIEVSTLKDPYDYAVIVDPSCLSVNGTRDIECLKGECPNSLGYT
jgi:hypothetical protein